MSSREEKRLSIVFGRALALALATPACWTTNDPPASADSGSTDATLLPDGAETSVPMMDAGVEDSACAKQTYNPQVMDLCADFWLMPCGLPSPTPRDNCFLSIDDCNKVCNGFFYTCKTIDDSCVDGGTVLDAEAGLAIECSWCVGGPGRAPVGLAPVRFARTLGGWFARAAHLEAASVHAFRILQRELAALGAPRSLVRAARRAELDEVRHARAMTRIARGHGARTTRPRIARTRRRSLEAIAIENATQGCVGETYAALEAHYQAERAPNEIRSTLRAIAKDELRHAALAWSFAAWIRPRLSAASARRVDAARDEALRSLELTTVETPTVLRGAGLPDANARGILLTELRSLFLLGTSF